LLGYLETHYYNSSDFETPGDYTIDDIVITELPQDEEGNYLTLPDPADNTLLIDAIETRTATYVDVIYEFYILKLNQGGGDAPHFTDSIVLNYSGNLQDETVFDSTVNADDPFDLIELIPGWRNAIPEFNTAASYVINGDGTTTYSNYGLGMMFLPSGLAYYSAPPVGITSYSNLIFKFELYKTEVNDHDEDGVPTYMEDLDGDQNIFSDDTDADDLPNFIDFDDDGDGTLTIDEDLEPDSDLLVDRDNDGDPTNDIGDGDPTNDDTDSDGIPNYLDTDNTESRWDE
jgi:FKBP-type peptidyl-prolyl cis-trans isomerase FkpA